MIRTYVQFILAKLRFHRLRPEFNGLFEYEEYVTLKGIDDPNEGWVSSMSSERWLIRDVQIRDDFRPHGLARPDRLLSEDDICSLSPFREQRVPYICARAPGQGELGHLPIHN